MVATPAEGGGGWLTLDPCSTRMPGDITGLISMKCHDGDRWVEGTRVLNWSPETGVTLG